MNIPYTFQFTHLTTKRSGDLFVERFMVNSKERKNDEWVLYTCFDVLFTVEDVLTLPTNNLLWYLTSHVGELEKRLSFYDWKNHSELTDEEAKECIIMSIFESKYMEEAFWQSEKMFYSLRISEQAIVDKSYEIEVIHKHKIEIGIDKAEQVVLELEGEGKNARVIYFAYYYHAFRDPIPISNFFSKEVEETFFKDVLKKTIIHRAMAPSAED